MDKPIINSHSHIFTGKHVPPFLAKKFVIWPFYYIFHLPTVLALFKFADKINRRLVYNPDSKYNQIRRKILQIKSFISQNTFFDILSYIIGGLLTIASFFILYSWFSAIIKPPLDIKIVKLINDANTYLTENLKLGLIPISIKILIVIALLIFFPDGRRVILFVFKQIWGFIKALPGRLSKQLYSRYLLIARYTLYKTQAKVFEKLEQQYPPGSSFVILPMDMTYMDAGKLEKDSYYGQMQELVELKKNRPNIYPFVFIDPRRIKEDPGFFSWDIENGNITLKECRIKDYIEEANFAGFKIYPALGYYPFDPELLPLWKYASDNKIPIITHCIRGTIFYRGKKKQEWNYHEIFKELIQKDTYAQLSLSESKNETFTLNFTHPLNFLCLLDETLLKNVLMLPNVKQKTKDLFGFKSADAPLGCNLKDLKICLGHFGGEDQWLRYIEADRYTYSQSVIRDPSKGINFTLNTNGKFSWDKLEQIWKYVDWYSIICSMMLQYPNVYADISYIVHDEGIFPLLKQTLNNEKLKDKVLFGTDFYVVRNHKSDKNLIADVLSELSEDEVDLIAWRNPHQFLNLVISEPK